MLPALLGHASSLRPARLVLLIAIPTPLALLLLSPSGLTCVAPILPSFFPALRSGHLLLALVWPWLLRLPTILNLRASLLWSGWCRPLHVFRPSLRWLRVWDSWSNLLGRPGTLDVRLSGTSLSTRSLSFLLSRCSWHCPLLVVLPHYGVTRPVAVFLSVKLLLLLDLSGIAVS